MGVFKNTYTLIVSTVIAAIIGLIALIGPYLIGPLITIVVVYIFIKDPEKPP